MDKCVFMEKSIIRKDEPSHCRALTHLECRRGNKRCPFYKSEKEYALDENGYVERR